jgi:hypothetical protein
MPAESTRPRRGNPANGGSFLVSNLVPISIPDRQVTLSYLPFESKEQLVSLRKEHFGIYIFRRGENDVITCVRLDGREPELGRDHEMVMLSNDLPTSAALIRHVLIDDYLNRGCEVTNYRPIEIISGSPRQNLLATVTPDKPPVPEWISIRQLCEMDLRTLRADGCAFVALAVNMRIRKRVRLAASDLAKQGVDLRRLFVAIKGQSDDPRIIPRQQIVGRVASIDGDTLQLEDARADIDSVSASEAFLRVDSEAFDRVLRALYREKGQLYAERLEAKLSEFSQGNARLEKIQAVLGDLKQRTITILIFPARCR